MRRKNENGVAGREGRVFGKVLKQGFAKDSGQDEGIWVERNVQRCSVGKRRG
jgi:hypothetical protein